MAYCIHDDFLEAFRNGGCFIFEGEEDQAPSPEDATGDTSAENPAEGETSDGGNNDTPSTEGDDAPSENPPEPNTQQPQNDTQEEPELDPSVASSPESTAGSVNTDGKQTPQVAPTAQKLANAVMKSINLRDLARKTLEDRGITRPDQKATVQDLLNPGIFTKTIEKFAVQSQDNYSSAVIARAILILANACSQTEVEKRQKAIAEKTKTAEKQQPQQSAPPKPTGGDGGAEPQPKELVSIKTNIPFTNPGL